MNELTCKKFWFLGFLGFIGFFEIADVISFFQGQGSGWSLLCLFWILWFDSFLPTQKYSDVASEKEKEK
ncbi:hypothetical protein [Methylophaga sp.]|uniref:hypothetical protein n=1 Tax=Methylophaga sp. TaxID=2024840 RepID=UPI003A8D93A1